MGIFDTYPKDQDVDGTAEIFEPSFAEYWPEHRLMFVPQSPEGVNIAVSGFVNVSLSGWPDENRYAFYDVRLDVGPYWSGAVWAVVPNVAIARIISTNADEDDLLGLQVQNLSWDTVNEHGPSGNELRIRLKFQIAVAGEYMQVRGLRYFFVANGRALGEGGINEPGPVVDQG